MKKSLGTELMGEFIGTFIMVFFGTAAVATSTILNAHSGLFQIAMIWAFAIMFGVYLTRAVCPAHFNPAVSLGFAIGGRFEWKKLIPYWLIQLCGAFVAGLVVYLLFNPSIQAYEAANNIIRGGGESQITARMFGEYYGEGTAVVPLQLAMFAEALGTFFIMLFIYFLTDHSNQGKPNTDTVPWTIGITVGLNITLIAPLTQAGFNPARDFGPRLVALIFGWGKDALPDAMGGFFWVYILSPLIGSAIAALLYTKVIEPRWEAAKDAA